MIRLPAYVCFFAWLALGAQVSLAQVRLCEVFYVDRNATGPVHDGSSWCSAFLSLSDALMVADGCDTVRVADGVYTPSSQGLADPRDATFNILSGMTFEGGYNGCGAIQPDLRDADLFETLLSGDLNGDDDTIGDNSDNAYHIVTADAVLESTTIDGFSIAHGNASGFDGFGGGILARSSILTISHCNIYDNHAVGRGGGISITSLSVSISNTHIHDNTAFFGGGGLDCFAGSLALIDSEISFNEAINGGGIDVSGGTLSLVRVIVRGNRASELPGADAGGGGGLLLSSAPTTINNSLLADNRAAFGGAVFLLNGHVNLSNSTIVRNIATNIIRGGGIFVSSGTMDITNSIAWGNRASGQTSGPAQISFRLGEVAFSHNDIEGWNSLVERNVGGVGDFGADPLFIDEDGIDDIPGTSDDDFRLSLASPCINRGDPTFSHPVNATDLYGNARTLGCRTDIGAYESTKLNLFGDYDGDDQLTLSDFAQLQLCFGAVSNTSSQATVCTCIFDADNNNVINLDDLPDFVKMFGGLVASASIAYAL